MNLKVNEIYLFVRFIDKTWLLIFRLEIACVLLFLYKEKFTYNVSNDMQLVMHWSNGKIENPQNSRRKNARRKKAEGEHREGNERSC